VNARVLARENTALSREDSLCPNITPARLVGLMTAGQFGALSNWCLQEVPDEQLADLLAEGFLMLLASAARGAIQADAQAWLLEVRSRGARWRSLAARA